MLSLKPAKINILKIQRYKGTTSIEELKNITQKVWKNNMSEYLNNLYKSMPIIDAKGGHSQYQFTMN